MAARRDFHCYHQFELRGRIVPCRRRCATGTLEGRSEFTMTCPRCGQLVTFPPPPDG